MLLTAALLWSTSWHGPQPRRPLAWNLRARALSAHAVSKDGLRWAVNLTDVNTDLEKVSLKTCALVGSGDILTGAARGEEIDAHDLVIRVCRIPVPEFFADFGTRTDVVVNAQDTPVQSMRPETIGGGVVDCSEEDSGCHSAGIVTLGISFDSDEYAPQRQWNRSHMFVGHFYPHNRQLALHFTQGADKLKRPTTGFAAFLAFSSVCDRLDVYGYGGRGNSRDTADHHVVDDGHQLDVEHEIEAAIAAGDWAGIRQAADMPEELAGEWRSYQKHVGKITLIDVEY